MSQFVIYEASGARDLFPTLREAKAAAKRILRDSGLDLVPIFRLGRCGDTEYMERCGAVGKPRTCVRS